MSAEKKPGTYSGLCARVHRMGRRKNEGAGSDTSIYRICPAKRGTSRHPRVMEGCSSLFTPETCRFGPGKARVLAAWPRGNLFSLQFVFIRVPLPDL